MRDDKIKWILSFFLLYTLHLTLYTVVRAQETKTEEPILITSDKVEYLDKKKEGEFVGNVKARQGRLLLTASKLRVILDANGKKIQQIIATGLVKLVQGDLTAMSEEANFYNEEQKVILTGKPQAFSRSNKFSGEKITVYLKEDRIVIETKVKGVIIQD
ncbi:hypothetical protein AUJ66_02640 [Candidatus Desantisbacteria bacterium CG1_02_38_46]|uniref:Organic solvent tolerance-like N-terminal domain-containing protein n=3 Tax=unclassified Candidatus Desantisiibacteriota TaxID=3106372 RepID=A0A2H9PCD5_9BACT|nr:MAG: hypothetical protein AUJ66_02640 [Candidatus Desantisbacteria bacterium CG1_02_38_46]PIU52095.1 MAG: hypothetical protein COS91_01025 [Candidatus Desantisbacteria bacterium CG07_land_8_20_14_0_80_39_15]PIZ16809.1 MAG: hypothetical protein COY51_01925 [Candidatus Desantisbacteria bacterium CG_4_10_14_0_8_um_filter_39_17]